MFFAVNLALAVLYVYFTGETEDSDEEPPEEKAAEEAKKDAAMDEVPVTSNSKLVQLCYKTAWAPTLSISPWVSSASTPSSWRRPQHHAQRDEGGERRYQLFPLRVLRHRDDH